ncbi:MAG: hypothetical protein KGI67_14965, partial [Pseudomonadota bacterium]|nr:hypothetical protein [Pseudomonadota bacterium]
MSRRADLLEPLKLPALVLAGVLLAAVLLLYGSGRFANAMADAHSELERRLTDANIHLQRLRGQHANLQTDAEAFARLAEHGLAGPEQRLALVHLMQVLPGETGVDQAAYQLAAQRAYARLPSDGGAPLNLSASAMTLQLA